MKKKLSILLGTTLVCSMLAMSANAKFISTDPVQFDPNNPNPAMFNRYAYAFNDPVNLVDPDGRAPDHVIDARSQALATAVRTDPRGTAIVAGIVTAGTLTAYAAPAVAAACTGACIPTAIGGSAGAGIEGGRQAATGEFNGVRLATATAVGAAGGFGSTLGTSLVGQAVGAGALAGTTDATAGFMSQSYQLSTGQIENYDFGAIASSSGTTAAFAGFGAAVGGAATNGLTGSSAFGASGTLTNRGVVAGATLGEAAAYGTDRSVDELWEPEE